MVEDFNTEKVKLTLKAVIPVIEKYTDQYWFMGSMIPTAMNGKLYREVHDFDIIIVPNNLEKLLKQIYQLGYKKKPLNFFRVSELMGVYVFSHDTLLDIGFFVISKVKKSYLIKSGPVKVEILFENLQPREYVFGRQKFVGIDPSFAYRLSLLHEHNPKRTKELELFKTLKITPAKWPIYQVYCWGRNANWMIDFLNFVLVIIGKIRTKLNLSYDMW